MEERNPSEVIELFLDFLKACDQEYKECVSEVWKYDRMSQDHLHDLEFAHGYEERCRVATKIHKQRNERREFKDRVAMVEKVAKFYSDKQNKQFIERLKNLLEEQMKVEDFLHGERHYNRRVGDDNDSN